MDTHQHVRWGAFRQFRRPKISNFLPNPSPGKVLSTPEILVGPGNFCRPRKFWSVPEIFVDPGNFCRSRKFLGVDQLFSTFLEIFIIFYNFLQIFIIFIISSTKFVFLRQGIFFETFYIHLYTIKFMFPLYIIYI